MSRFCSAAVVSAGARASSPAAPRFLQQAGATGANLDYEFVQALPEELTCSICMKVLCEPHLVNCCEQQYCKSCLDKWRRMNKTCPHCRSTEFNSMLLKQRSRKIGELRVYCPNKQHGCKVELKISEYDSHLAIANNGGCPYVKLDCPNNCKAKVYRGKIKTHTQKECPKRSVNCAHCKAQGEHQHIVGNHTKECPSFPISCPQKCGAELIRKDLDAHRSTCPTEPVSCPFIESGCKAKICRNDLEKHIETNVLQHMTMLAESHAVLQTKVKAITSLIKDAQNDREIIPKIYTILADSSTLTPGYPTTLTLSEGNMKSGHHYIVLHDYKFKLEWKINKCLEGANKAYYGGGERYTFMLHSVVDDAYAAMTATTNFDVAIRLDSSNGTFKICRGKVQGGGSILIGTQFPRKIILQYGANEHYCVSCQNAACRNKTPNHACCYCGNVCQGYMAFYQN